MAALQGTEVYLLVDVVVEKVTRFDFSLDDPVIVSITMRIDEE